MNKVKSKESVINYAKIFLLPRLAQTLSVMLLHMKSDLIGFTSVIAMLLTGGTMQCFQRIDNECLM